jgi:hypothetical protein
MRKQRWFVFILTVVFCFSAHGVILAVEDKHNRLALRGVSQVWLSVEKMPPHIVQAGLTSKKIKRDMELKLRMAGMKLLSGEDFDKTTDRQWILVSVQFRQPEVSGYVYSIDLYFFENQYTTQFNKFIPVRTYNVPRLFGYTHNLSDIRKATKAVMSRFINDWLAENPK